MKSDGSPWRPLVHIEDIARAFLAIVEAPRDLVHLEAFNVGRTEENFQIRDVAKIVEEVVTGSKVSFADGASPDTRNYRVNCDKIARVLPGFQPQWTVRKGVEELYNAYLRHSLSLEDLTGRQLQRIRYIDYLQDSGQLDADLRWVASEVSHG
jgi:nucleoside-diphosphate-sugar epimerase